MNYKSLLTLVGVLFVSASSAFTAEECAEYLGAQEELLNFIGQNIATNERLFWLLHQPDNFGVIVNAPVSMCLYHQNLKIYMFPFQHLQIPRSVVFGYELSGNELISGWLGFPKRWLYCQSYTYDHIEPFDACCIYDEKTPRKRSAYTGNQPDGESHDKKIRLLDENKATFSYPMDCQ